MSKSIGLYGLPGPELARFRRVLEEAFGEPVIVRSIDEYFREHPDGILVVSSSDASWRAHLEQARTRSSRVIALVNAESEIDVSALYGGGVAAVIGVPEPAVTVVSIIRLVAADMTVLPTKLFPPRQASAIDTDLLAQLATSCSVRELAQRNFCSERTMYRRMRLLYNSLGIRGRADVALLATGRDEVTSSTTG
jgi:DNA-binding NarL/FixJ family response regulator